MAFCLAALGACSGRSSGESTGPSDTPPSPASFTDAFVARARAQHPGADVHATAPLHVAIGDGPPLDLRNLSGECNGVARGCEGAFDRWVRVLFAAPSSHAIDRASVRAVLQPSDAAEQSHLAHRPFVGPFVEAFVVDTPDTIEMLTEPDRAELGMDADALHALALANMRAAFTEPSILAASEALTNAAPGVHVLKPPDSYGNARLLQLDRWPEVAASVRGTLLAASPARDIVIFAGDGSSTDVLALRFLARDMFAHEPHPLSPALLRWTGSDWALLDDNTAPLAPPPPP